MYLLTFQHKSFAVSVYSHEQRFNKLIDEETNKPVKDANGDFVMVPDKRWIACG